MGKLRPSDNLSAAAEADHPWKDLLLAVILVGSGLGSPLAWILPQSKPNALLGRLNGWQISLALLLCALFISSAIIAFTPKTHRRASSFRVTAVWLGLATVMLPWELCCLWLPSEHLADNPFYVFLGSGVVDDTTEQLRFVRPAHLRWRGRSRGDLAMVVDIPDPYAQDIVYETDYQGFRNGRDISQAEVIFLGDSFTEAGNMPEEQTFVQLTVDQLNIVGRNLGRCGYGPSEELIIMKQYGLECRPRCVVWQFSETNDLNDEVNFQNWITMGRPHESVDSRLPASEAWKRRSPSYKLFKLVRQAEPWPFSGTFRDAQGKPHSILFSKPPDANHRPIGHDGWPVMVDTIRAGVKLLRENQLELVCLLIPKKMRVMGPHVEFSELTRQFAPGEWDLAPDQTLAWHLSQLFRTLDVTFIDTTSLLKERAAAGDLVYLPLDSHLSARGHVVVAKNLVRALRGKL